MNRFVTRSSWLTMKPWTLGREASHRYATQLPPRGASRIDLVTGLRHDGQAGIRVIPAGTPKRLPGCKNPPIRDGITLFILLD